MRTKPAPTMTCQVTETLACGYAGLSCSAATRALMRQNVPFIEVMKYRKTCRSYLVADCVDYKIRRESLGQLTLK